MGSKKKYVIKKKKSATKKLTGQNTDKSHHKSHIGKEVIYKYTKYYPSILDPDFSKKIAGHALFKKYKSEVNQERLDNLYRAFDTNEKPLEDSKKQNINIFILKTITKMLRNFMSPYSPYRSLLIYHEMGVGKTCTAITIAESLKNIVKNSNTKIYVIRPDEFSRQIFRKEAIYDGKPLNQCTGDTYIQNPKLKELVDWFSYTNLEKTKVKVPKGIVKVAIDYTDEEIEEIRGEHTEIEQPLDADAFEMERDAETIQNYLKRQRDLLSEFIRLDDGSFAVRLQIASLNAEIKHLKKQFNAVSLLESELDAEAVFDGPSVINNEIDSTLLGKSLLNIQQITHDLTRGDAAWRLQAALAAGSFKIRFRLVNDTTPATVSDSTPSLFEEFETITNEESGNRTVSGIDEIVRLLANSEDKAEVLNALPTKQSRRSYAELMDVIDKQKVEFEFRTRKNPIGTTITALEARKVSIWLKESTTVVSRFEVKGTLLAASLKTGSFQIEQLSAGTLPSKVFSGKNAAAIESLRGLKLGMQIRAVLEETKRNKIEMDDPEIAYKLISIVSDEESESTDLLLLP
jgi:hypothetical protein